MKLNTKVLLTEPINEKATKILEDAVEKVIVAPDRAVDAVASVLDDKVEGIIIRFSVFNRQLFDKAPNLKVIVRHGIGVELIDVDAATDHGVMVVNTPTAATVSVAEHVLMMVLVLSKKLFIADHAIRKGNYAIKESYGPDDAEGKTLGLVGFGRIAREAGRRCLALGMKVITYDPYLKPEAVAGSGATMVDSLERVLAEADFVSMHTPLTPTTRHLISDKQFATMKPTAYFINCSRGEVVDEAALVRALQAKTIAGAGLDVFEAEPPATNNPLFAMENVVVTPHSAALTANGKFKMATHSVDQLLKVLRGEKPDSLMNPKVLEKLKKK